MTEVDFHYQFVEEADHIPVACAQQVVFLAPQTPQQTEFPPATFTSLPPEVRVQIYSHYFDGICVVVDEPGSIILTDKMVVPPGCPGRRFGWIYYDRDKQRSNLFALMFISPDIYHEILPTLYKRVTFYFERRLDFRSAHDCSSLDVEIKGSQVRKSQPVFSPFQYIENLSINLASTADFGKRLCKNESRRVTESILDITTYSMPKLKHLQLEINLRAGVFDEKSNGLMQPWFLRRLCRMKHLQYLGIDFTGITTRTRSTRAHYASTCTFALQGVLNWHCYGGAESWGAKIDEHFDEETLNDRVLQLKIGRAILRFLEATKNERQDHKVLLDLLTADVDKFTLL